MAMPRIRSRSWSMRSKMRDLNKHQSRQQIYAKRIPLKIDPLPAALFILARMNIFRAENDAEPDVIQT